MRIALAELTIILPPMVSEKAPKIIAVRKALSNAANKASAVLKIKSVVPNIE